MEEIDTKSIQAVQAAISFLDHVKIGSTNNRELKKVEELENLIKNLENAKLELKAKDSAYKQALIDLDHHRKTADELSNLLRICDSKKQFYINECQESSARTNELESTLKQMAYKVTDSKKVQEQLSGVVSELVSAQDQLLNMEAQVATMQVAMSSGEATKHALSEEKQKSEVLTRRVSEMNEIIVGMKKRVLEIEREKAGAVAEKETELEFAAKAAAEAEKQLERLRGLEDQLLDKMAVINSLQAELNQANELRVSSQKALADAICALKKLEENLKLQEKNNVNQADKIIVLEAELGKTHMEVNRLNEQIENMKSKLETEQVEIALLKFELHKEKSKLAAVEARAQVEKSEFANRVGLTAHDDTLDENRKDADNRKELELAMVKIGQLRTKAAQAISRAEAAEKAKAMMEEHMMKKYKEHSVALDGKSVSRDAGSSTNSGDGDGSYYSSLAKVLT